MTTPKIAFLKNRTEILEPQSGELVDEALEKKKIDDRQKLIDQQAGLLFTAKQRSEENLGLRRLIAEHKLPEPELEIARNLRPSANRRATLEALTKPMHPDRQRQALDVLIDSDHPLRDELLITAKRLGYEMDWTAWDQGDVALIAKETLRVIEEDGERVFDANGQCIGRRKPNGRPPGEEREQQLIDRLHRWWRLRTPFARRPKAFGCRTFESFAKYVFQSALNKKLTKKQSKYAKNLKG